ASGSSLLTGRAYVTQSTCSSPMGPHPSPSTWWETICGVAVKYCGNSCCIAAKWSELTCGPAPSSVNASISTYVFGSSTLRDHSNHRLPGSARVASVKGREISGQRSAYSALIGNFTLIRIMSVIVPPAVAPLPPRKFRTAFCSITGFPKSAHAQWGGDRERVRPVQDRHRAVEFPHRGSDAGCGTLCRHSGHRRNSDPYDPSEGRTLRLARRHRT